MVTKVYNGSYLICRYFHMSLLAQGFLDDYNVLIITDLLDYCVLNHLGVGSLLDQIGIVIDDKDICLSYQIKSTRSKVRCTDY